MVKKKIKVVDVEKGSTGPVHTKGESHDNPEQKVQSESIQTDKDHQQEPTHSDVSNKINIKFPGSELIRSRMPKPFEVAEAIATDWVNDGKFDQVPVDHPLAKAALQQGFKKAKEIEKKVLNSPVTEKVAMQAFTYAMKAQGLVHEIKTKVKSKSGKEK